MDAGTDTHTELSQIAITLFKSHTDMHGWLSHTDLLSLSCGHGTSHDAEAAQCRAGTVMVVCMAAAWWLPWW